MGAGHEGEVLDAAQAPLQFGQRQQLQGGSGPRFQVVLQSVMLHHDQFIAMTYRPEGYVAQESDVFTESPEGVAQTEAAKAGILPFDIPAEDTSRGFEEIVVDPLPGIEGQ